ITACTVFLFLFFFFQAEDGIRDFHVTGVSDVCSSDLTTLFISLRSMFHTFSMGKSLSSQKAPACIRADSRDSHSCKGKSSIVQRSEERRVGKECRCRGWRYHEKEEGRSDARGTT